MIENEFLKPGWDAKTGLLPPVYPGHETAFDTRSPYRVTPEYFVTHFGKNNERLKLLRSFFDFRARIYQAGGNGGFQWVNGSFVENKELIKKKKPNDIDVVTFLENTPSDSSLADSGAMKRLYSVDSHWVIFSRHSKAELVYLVVYWYSLWGHQRDSLQWKGFLEIPLDKKLDDDAIKLLNQKEIV